MSNERPRAAPRGTDEEAFLDAMRHMGLSSGKAKKVIDNDEDDVEEAQAETEEPPSRRNGKVRPTHGRESITVSVAAMTRNRLAILHDLAQMPDDISRALEDRPRVRADCEPGGKWGARPCPFFGCKYNLFIDVDPETGSLIFNFPNKDFDKIPETCALDVARKSRLNNGMTLEEVGDLMHLTRERIRQVEVRAYLKLGPVAKRMLDGDGRIHLPVVAPREGPGDTRSNGPAGGVEEGTAGAGEGIGGSGDDLDFSLGGDFTR